MAGSHPEHEASVQEQRLEQKVADIGCKLLVLSGKGGVGKSTVAVNLALSLATAGKRVGLLDVDLHGPSVPRMLGLDNEGISLVGEELLPVYWQNTLAVMSIAFLLPRESDAVIWRGPRKYGAIRQLLGETAWGKLDYLVVDAPPGTGDEPLSVAQLAGENSHAILVTTPQQVAVADVRRCINFCHTMQLPILGIVENMCGFVCPHCGTRSDPFQGDGGNELAGENGIALLGSIPLLPAIASAGDSGYGPGDAAAQYYAPIAEQVVKATQ